MCACARALASLPPFFTAVTHFAHVRQRLRTMKILEKTFSSSGFRRWAAHLSAWPSRSRPCRPACCPPSGNTRRPWPAASYIRCRRSSAGGRRSPAPSAPPAWGGSPAGRPHIWSRISFMTEIAHNHSYSRHVSGFSKIDMLSVLELHHCSCTVADEDQKWVL